MKKLGRYDIVEVRAKGAMGLVYKAHDPNIDRTVAIKTVLVQHLSGEQAAEYESRFRAEARAAGKLQHANIVGVYDAGRDEGVAYIVMEYIDGEDLSQARARGEKFTLERTLGIVTQLLAALNYAHEQGVVHRDIKPANVMLDRSGRVKLSDFGVARITGSGEATRTQGSMVGTLKYMSPEQVQGLRDIDNRSDLFAVGVLLYEMVTGQKPFDGPSDFAISTAIVMQDPKLPSAVNPALTAAYDTAIMKSLAKDREQRYPTARDFALALRSLGRASDQQTKTPSGASEESPLVPPTGTGNRLAATPGTVAPATSSSAITAVSQEMELVYWKEIQDSDDAADFVDFLKAFPNGTFTGRARRRLRMLSPSDDSQSSATGTKGGAPGESTSGTAQTGPAQPPPVAADATVMPSAASERARAEAAAELAAERARREQQAREAAESLRREQEAKEVAERARKEQEALVVRQAEERLRREQQAREAADKARKEQEAREAAERARKEKEALAAQEAEERERLRREQQAREAAEKARKEQEAREAADKARKEQEALAAQAAEERERLRREQQAREAAERTRKEQEALTVREAEERERLRREQQARETAEKARKEQEALAAREAEERERLRREQQAREVAEKARKEQEAREAAERTRKEKEALAAREAAESARKEQEAQAAREAEALKASVRGDDATRVGRARPLVTGASAGEDVTRLAPTTSKLQADAAVSPIAAPLTDPLALLDSQPSARSTPPAATATAAASAPSAAPAASTARSAAPAPAKSKLGLLVGGGVAVAAVAGIAIMMGRGDPKPAPVPAPSAPVAAPSPAPQAEPSERVAPPPPPPKGLDKAGEAERARQEKEAREASQKAAKDKETRDAAAKTSQDAAAAKAAQDKAAQEAATKAAQDKAAQDAAARAAQEKAAQDAAAKAAQDKAAQDAAARAAQEKAAQDAAARAAQEKANQEAAAKAAQNAAATKAAQDAAAAKAREEASPAFQYQRAQDLEKAGQMRPAKAAYERAAEGGNVAAAKRRWEIAVAEKAPADETARWQRRAFQLGAAGVPEPKGPAVLR